MYRIFIVEDDSKIAEIIGENLEKFGYSYKIAESYEAIIEEISTYKPHLILLDIILPKYDGFHWCRKIRQLSKVPVIFISSRDTTMDAVMALNMGGDDFIQKPFSTDILIAKVKTLLRRTYSYTDNTLAMIEKDGRILDLNRHVLIYGEKIMPLTANEFKILQKLFENYGKTVSRQAIIKALWDDERFVDDNTLTVNVNRLRKKLEDSGINNFIKTQKGKGYRIQ